ncbi:hypothetical protein [Derxia gummosa]|uniref:Uncharacterized protein n=1 Tax=Derxia gummosa DSM 723 TaxID=1121388 RepID=A0A8B6XC09_9BURK|nr:hypothetical protein [Derxia gummosa]
MFRISPLQIAGNGLSGRRPNRRFGRAIAGGLPMQLIGLPPRWFRNMKIQKNDVHLARLAQTNRSQSGKQANGQSPSDFG